MNAALPLITPGQRVAVAVGSRKLASLVDIVRATVEALRARGAQVFIVPAMGSHGGATQEGQQRVLERYGITEAQVGAPIDPSLETLSLGRTESGFSVPFARSVLAADALLLINRVKPHTSFRAPIESGLVKMLVIGLGKHAGATEIHAQGYTTFAQTLPEAFELICKHVPVLGGLATVENSTHAVGLLEFVPTDAILEREPTLLDHARSLMPRIPFARLDVLIVDQVGKDLSGTGMDPNVTGRPTAAQLSRDQGPQRLVALRLTNETEGNANGVGAADIVTHRLAERVDWTKTWTNNITSTELAGGRLPIVMATDRDAIALALHSCTGVGPEGVRLARISSTMDT
ncbi:MAG: DUF362 domain-containing protein, partial [Myxococcota bacterium]